MLSSELVTPQAMPSVFGEDIFSATSTTDFAIPDATSTSASDTCVMDNGFLPISSEPLPTAEEPDNPGIAPARKNFNGLFYLSTDQRVFLQNGGYITYDDNVATAIGGYPQGAILNYYSDGVFAQVRSLVDNNQYNFVSNPSYIGTYWQYVSGEPVVISILKQIYPIGAIYIGTSSTCPMAALFGTWELVAKNKALWTGDGTNANTTIAAGLPNITGTVYNSNINEDMSMSGDGCFSLTYKGQPESQGQGDGTGNTYNVLFNASRSNSIYGNSNTVQPPAYVVNVWRRTA